MQLESGKNRASRAQRKYARLAGFLFLATIALAFAGGSILSYVAGNGTFAQRAARIAASEHLYRTGLSIVLIVSLGSALLAFSLYSTLRPVDNLLAQLAMIFTLGDSFLALIVRMCGFVRVHLYASAQTGSAGMAGVQTLSDLMRSIADTTENLGGICFGMGLLIFFYLFFKSSYIPRALSALGLFASAVWIVLYFGSLIFPQQHELLQRISFPPMGLADVITGFYLLLFAVRAENASTSHNS
ncbi:MAG TPA: DUF4386 domain-containing protein [Terriglobales bacterium]